MKRNPLNDIIIRGCRVNNLKGIDLDIPRGELVVITGVSGSGKSSLAFDTLYAEGQRRYVDSLSAYARQFLMRMKKPECELIKNLPPAVAIEQRVVSRNPRSTVGTSSEIDDYLRILMSRLGKLYSPTTGELVKRHTSADVVAAAHQIPIDSKLYILADLYPPEDRSLVEHLMLLLGQGYSRVLIDNMIMRIEEVSNKEVSEAKIVQLIVDRLSVHTGEDHYESRLGDSIEIALYEGHETCTLRWQAPDGSWSSAGRLNFSARFEADGRTFTEPTPDLFNFNSPAGACPICGGFGSILGIDPERVIPDDSLSLYEGCVDCWKGAKSSEWAKAFIRDSQQFNFPIHTAYSDLTNEQKDLLWHGHTGGGWGKGTLYGIDDYFEMLQRDVYKIQNRVRLAHYRGKSECYACHGGRLKEDALLFTYQGKNYHQIGQLSIKEAIDFFAKDPEDPDEAKIAERLLKEIRSRLRTLDNVGLGYLTLERRSNTLSGGESQRINLATRLGNSLVGSMYILDEPSIGLHDRDTDRLIEVMKELRDQGNSVIVVEHDELTIRAADYLIDMGLDAGRRGGEVIYHGKPSEITSQTPGYTAAYLTGLEQIPIPTHRKPVRRKLMMHRVHKNNLKGFDVEIPLFMMTVVTGVSGSGKSTLISELLVDELQRIISARPQLVQSKMISGDIDLIEQVLYVDQNSVGRSTRSNPVTYIDAFTPIRELYADQPLAKQMGYKPYFFSFNKEGGRCEVCKGEGVVEVPMQFMTDITLVCDACEGKRFQKNILEVTYHGVNISELLEMTVDQAIEFFTIYPAEQTTSIIRLLEGLQRVGLGYLQLGQNSSTLSGGETQRLKLAYYLGRDHEPHTLFIFDEPTTGLHFHDISTLLAAFQNLIDNGHSVLVIEHNMEIIKSADHIIDLGPDGGDKGGFLVATGTPEEVAACPDSITGKYLLRKLQQTN
jgi:excinuclease ABC, A subunit